VSRRTVLREGGGQDVPPLSAPDPQSHRTPPGHCPKCNRHIGRGALVRAHAKTCQGDADRLVG
jgi:hypothetical protein